MGLCCSEQHELKSFGRFWYREMRDFLNGKHSTYPNGKKREAREDRVNFRSAWRPAGMSRHNQQRSIEEVRSLLGGTHAMKSVKPSIDIIEGLSTGVNIGASRQSPSFMLGGLG